MNELITVIVPVYNTEKYIENCIKCLLRQSYTNLEILLINDGSTDDSRKLCEKYQKKDSRIKVTNKKNGGAATARNIGLDICTGEYIMFVDSDDCIPENAVMTLYQAIRRTNADIVQGMHVKNNVERNLQNDEIMSGEIQVYSGKDFLEKDLLNNVPWGKLYKRIVWKNRRFKNGLMIYEDFQLLYQMIYEAERVANLKSCVYCVNERPGSITRSEYSDRQLVLLEIDKERVAYFKDRNEDILLEHAYCDFYNHLLHLYCVSRKKWIKILYRHNFKHFICLKCINWRVKLRLFICFFFPQIWNCND